jgi:uncharacterized coiled-coil protein SlyX
MILRKPVTPEDAAQISQRRRELELRVKQLETTFTIQQDVVGSIGQVLLCGAKNRETRADKERKRLKAIGDELFAAEQELRDYNSANPSEQQLMELERLRVFRAQEQERERRRTCQQQQ